MSSREYDRALEEARRHHASSKTYSGRFLRPHKPWLVELAGRLGIASALDYGCGKGEQYAWVDPTDSRTIEEALGFTVAKYDPAWPPYAAEPKGRFDLVICTHVLGSIPLTDLGWVLDSLFSSATKAVFIAEKIGPVKKKALSSPELRPVGWTAVEWLELIAPHRRPGIETHLSVNYRTEAGEAFLGRFRLS